jgi:hypothetical protein
VNKKYKKTISTIFILLGIWFFVLPIVNPPKPILIPKENTVKTNGWKLYENRQYHFSFKYPEGLLSNFQVNSIGKTSQILKQLSSGNYSNIPKDPNVYNVTFEADGYKFSGKLDEFINKNLRETKNLKRQKITLGEIEGVRITNVEKKSDAYFYYNVFKHGNYIYNFAILADDPVLIGGNTKLLEDIISTVKFY